MVISSDKETRRQPKKLSELEELIGTALRASHVARDKGFYTVSREATTCVHALQRIRSLPLKARAISASDSIRSMEFLAKNGNPKIRSEARSVLNHWRSIISGNSGSSRSTREAYPKKEKSARRTEPSKKNECLSREPSKAIKNGGANSCFTPESVKETSPGYKEAYETLKKTHEAMKDHISIGAENSRRCVVTLKGLFLVPRAVTRDLLVSTDAGLMMSSLAKHTNTNVRSMAESLLAYWFSIIYHRN